MATKRSTFKTLFYIKKTSVRKDGKAPIMVRITIDGQDIVFSSKLFVNPTIWKNGAASGKSVEAVKTNGLLNEITTRLTNHYHRILVEELCLI